MNCDFKRTGQTNLMCINCRSLCRRVA